MAKRGNKAAKEDDSHKCSTGKVDVRMKKSEMKTGIGNNKTNISYRDLLNPCKGYVNQEEAEAFRVLFRGGRKASLDKVHFNSILHVAEKVICMSTETYNSCSILAIVCSILGALSRHCNSEDTVKGIETIVSLTKQRFTIEMIERTIPQVPSDLRDKAYTLLKYHVKHSVEDVKMVSKTFDLKSIDEEMNAPSTSKAKPGLYVTLVLHLRHFGSFRMRKILQLFQHSEDNAMKQLIGLHFQTFKVQADYDEMDALGEVIRVLLGVDPERENLHLTFDCLVWMQKLSSKSEKRRELTRTVARDFCKRRGTLWVAKWISEKAQAEDQPVGVDLVVNSLETIDLSTEYITELLKKDHFVPALQESIAKRFSDFDSGAKEDLVNQIVNYLREEDLSTETNMNMLIADLLLSLLWMTYYNGRSLFNQLFEKLTEPAADFHASRCYKTVALLYSWFKTGAISPLLVNHVKGKGFWFRERSPLLYFEFCLAVTEPHFQDSICNEFKKYLHGYFFNPGGIQFLQYILCPPPIAFNDTLKRRTQEERLTTIESMRKALIPRLCALINEMPAGVCLWSEVRCSFTSKLIMNLDDPQLLRNVVKKVTDCIVTSMARCTVDKTYPWVLRLLKENMAMDTFLYSVQMAKDETEYFSDLFIDFFPAKDFVEHTRSPVWRSLILMFIETGIPSVLFKVKHRLKHLKPPTTMKSTEEIEFWQTVSDLD